MQERYLDQDYIDGINRAYRGSNLKVSDLYEIYRTHDINTANNIIEKLVQTNKEDILKNNSKTDIYDTSLNVTDFRKLQTYKNKEAIARMIQHIVVTKKGTYPNNPDFGVGIEDYLFELATPSIKSDLTTEINLQVNKWIQNEVNNLNSDINIKSELQFIRTLDDYITLAIYFKVFEKDLEGENNYDLNLFYTGNSNNKKIISHLEL